MSTMNLFEDWSIDLAEKLCNNGINLSENQKKAGGFLYFEFLRRKITLQQRKIHLPPDFECPQELLTGWNSLKECIESGKDINPYLSKSSNNPNAIDKMFNSWGIKHFHIGEKIKNNFCERTGTLIFAIVKEYDFYVIGLYEHGDWTQKSIIKKIHHCYPFIIENYKVTSMSNVSGTGDQEEIDRGRRLNINYPFHISDGTVYLFGGITISGHNEIQIRLNGYMIESFSILEKRILEIVDKDEKYRNSELHLKVINDEKYFVVCNKTGFEHDVTEYMLYFINECLKLIKM